MSRESSLTGRYVTSRLSEALLHGISGIGNPSTRKARAGGLGAVSVLAVWCCDRGEPSYFAVGRHHEVW